MKKTKKYMWFLKKEESYDSRGFVILFAMMISSIILLVSTTMYNISKKDIIISSYARESQRAFYAANSALECALFNDVSDYLDNGTYFPISAVNPYAAVIKCGGRDIQIRMLNPDSGNTGGDNEFDHSFVFRYPNINDTYVQYYDTGCAYVLVEKKLGEDGVVAGTKKIETRITAVGFNMCKLNENDGYYDIPDYDDPTLLERRISSKYNTIYYVNP